MAQQNIASLKTYFDELEETKGDDESRAWLNIFIDAKAELATFVGTRLGGGTGRYVGYLKDAFNFSYRFSFSDGRPDVIIRFPIPGHTATAFRDEKVVNEVQTMEYLRQNTDIPIPRIHSWGLTAESPQNFGPFIIMDFVDGILLSTLLKEPDQERMVLNPNIEDATLDKIYHQLARYMLQLSQLTFPKIGAISKDVASGTWRVSNRPFTYNMNELVTVAGYPVDQLPVAPFDSAREYLRSVANEHLTHLRIQRNLADDPQIAQDRYIARHRFAQLISEYYPQDSEIFIPYCDDMRPANMLINPETLQITAVLDFEFTNAMPAEFSYDPPWWLLLSGPDMWLENSSMGDFLALYEPRMEKFVQAVERVETENPLQFKKPGSPVLSARMRDSWSTGQFWFNYAARKSFDIDLAYWAGLHREGTGVELLDDKAHAEMEPFVKMKMEQLAAYKEECSVRFPSQD